MSDREQGAGKDKETRRQGDKESKNHGEHGGHREETREREIVNRESGETQSKIETRQLPIESGETQSVIHAPQSKIEIRKSKIESPSSLFWLFALLLTLVSMGLQGTGLYGQAVIDDHGWIHDAATRGCDNNLRDCFQHQQMIYYYRPLIGVSFVLSNRWFAHFPLNGRDEAFPFHVENLLQHGLVVLLVFWLLRLLFRRDLPAALGGLLFALHPLHVPVTTFIGGRPDNMAMIFLALYAIGLLNAAEGKGEREKEKALLSLSSSEEVNEDAAADTFSLCLSPFPLCLSLMAFTAAIFTKEQSILMVLLAPLLVTMHHPGWDWKQWKRLWPLSLYALPVSAYVILQRRVSLMEQMNDPTRSFFSQSLWSLPLHIQMIGRTCWYFTGAFLWPTVDHMHSSTLGPWDWPALGPLGHSLPPDLPTPPPVWVALGGYAALGIAAWLLYATWRNPACRFCLLWLLLTLLPCLNIIPVPSQFVAPYRAAIPLFGVCGIAGAGIAALLDRRMPARVSFTSSAHFAPMLLLFGLIAVCIRFMVVTRADIPQWRDDITLMYAEMRADPNFTPARGGEAFEFNRRGEYDKALGSYNKMLRQLVPEARTPEEIAEAGLKPDWPRRAASASSLRYNNIPYLANTLSARGYVYQSLGRWTEAAADYRAALHQNPLDRVLGDWLAYACDHAELYVEEEAVLKKQIADFPDSYRLSQLGSLYYRQGRWPEARDTLRKALNAPASKTGSRTDLGLAQRQYDEAFVRTLPEAPSKTNSHQQIIIESE